MTTFTVADAITCRGLTKDFGDGHGVFDLDLDVHRGEVFGFVGPNGAGKTTTLRLLMDLIRPTRGTASILGLDVHQDAIECKRRIGYLAGELPQFPRMRAEHVVELMANLRGGVDRARVGSLAERLQLDLSRNYEELSHGNKQKVALVLAFMHRPELLLLDEPTLGLDPLMQQEFRRLLQEAVADGATVLLSSHGLGEVESTCDRICLIRAGHALRVGTMAELRQVRVHRVEAIVPGGTDITSLSGVPGVTNPALQGARLNCSVHGSVGPLVRWLAAAGVEELDIREMSLEEVFLVEFGA